MAQPDEKDQTPYRLMALVFDDMWKADEARAALRRMAGEDRLLELKETALIIKQYNGKIRVNQDQDIVAKDQQVGHVAGLLAAAATGTMPFILAGTVAGRLIGRLTDDGVTNQFVKEVAGSLQPGRSALIVVGRSDEERRGQVIERMKPFNATILQSDLPLEVLAEIETAANQNAA